MDGTATGPERDRGGSVAGPLGESRGTKREGSGTEVGKTGNCDRAFPVTVGMIDGMFPARVGCAGPDRATKIVNGTIEGCRHA